MRNIVENYSPDKSFWEVNPQFTVIDPFRKLYKSDRTKGKIFSSSLMWAISFIYHPKSDVYYVDGKEYSVFKNMLDLKTDKEVHNIMEKYSDIIEAFIPAALTQAEKSLVAWENRLQDRDSFLAEQHYTFGYNKVEDDVTYEFKDNTKALDDMASKTAKLYEEYFKIRKDLNDEEAISKNKKIDSATATGDI